MITNTVPIKSIKKSDQINADASIEASFLSDTAIHILPAVFPFPTLRAFAHKSSNL